MQDVWPLADRPQEDWLNCPVCHSSDLEDLDPVFLRLYIPGQPDRALEFACGPVCAVDIRTRAMRGAELLPDRQAEVGGLAPKRPSNAGWDELAMGAE